MRETTRVVRVLAALVVGTLLAIAVPAAATAAVTTTTLTSSTNPSVVGQAVTLTATITGAAPTGSVSFAEPGVVLGAAPVTDGIATLVVSSWAAGDHAVTATYSGDGGNDASSGSLTQSVVAPVKPPKIRLRVSTSEASVGDKVTLRWRSKNADSVKASGDWGGEQKPKGSKKIRITERGKHVFKLTVRNASGKKSAKVTVVATRKSKELELRVTDELVLAGTDVDVTADGLAKGEGYTVRLDGKPVLTGKADKKGDVARTFEVARTTPEGALELTITGSNPGRVGSAVLNVLRPKTLEVEVVSNEVVKTHNQTLIVEHLAAGEEITVIYAGKELTTGKADKSGQFTFTFNVGTKTGERTVKVIGAFPTRVGEATFKVTRGDSGEPT